MPIDRGRSRFSLRGLLAVVAAFSVLFALAALWLNQMREYQRRTECIANQKQIALAIYMYYEANRVYPSSAFPKNNDVPIGETNTITQYVPGATTPDTAAPYSFLVHLMPYLEQTHVYEQVDFDKNAFDLENHKLAANIIPLFTCPSFQGPARTTDRQNSYSAGIKPALTQYKAVSATTLTVLENTDDILRSSGHGGAIHPYGHVRALPATSQTVLIGETREDDLSAWVDGSTIGLFGLDASRPPGATLNNVNQANPRDPTAYPYGAASFGGKTMRWGPSSFHAGLVIHAFADTNTRPIGEEIDQLVYEALITRQSRDNGQHGDWISNE